MNETEKQEYIRLETMKLQRLSNIIHYATEIMHTVSTNIRSASDYNDEYSKPSTHQFFEEINIYKSLLLESGELK